MTSMAAITPSKEKLGSRSSPTSVGLSSGSKGLSCIAPKPSLLRQLMSQLKQLPCRPDTIVRLLRLCEGSGGRRQAAVLRGNLPAGPGESGLSRALSDADKEEVRWRRPTMRL